ncbi:MAG: hypothetical protein HEP71_27585 [Roseivirga sp.]|nr:hypothetical protein [Roseivirga sp.]
MAGTSENISQRISEALKTSHNSIITFWAFILMSTLLTTRSNVGDSFKLPFIDITLDILNATEVLIVFGLGALYRGCILQLYAKNLESLFTPEELDNKTRILSRPPSTSSYRELFLSSKLSRAIQLTHIAIGTILALVVVFLIGCDQITPEKTIHTSWAISVVLDLGLIGLSVNALQKFYSGKQYHMTN